MVLERINPDTEDLDEFISLVLWDKACDFLETFAHYG